MKSVTFALILCSMLACTSQRPPIQTAPIIEIQEKIVKSPCIISIKPVESAILPIYPPYDPENPKEWAVKVREIYKKREALRDEEIKTLRDQIYKHNSLRPLCS